MKTKVKNEIYCIAIKGGNRPIVWYEKPSRKELVAFEDGNWTFYYMLNTDRDLIDKAFEHKKEENRQLKRKI